MEKFENFIGGSYQGLAQSADAERSVNLYPEKAGSPGAAEKTDMILLSKPGLAFFAELQTISGGLG